MLSTGLEDTFHICVCIHINMHICVYTYTYTCCVCMCICIYINILSAILEMLVGYKIHMRTHMHAFTYPEAA